MQSENKSNLETKNRITRNDRYALMFTRLDVDNDGFLSTKDLASLLPNTSEDDLNWILNQFIPNGTTTTSNNINLEQFITACETNRNGRWRKAYDFSYKRYQTLTTQPEATTTKTFDQILKTESGILVSQEESQVMAQVLLQRNAFLQAFSNNQNMK